ncbi:hypothetical protein GY45DRAFT_1341197 [Cubamyces sp. BRFM 1775]|nr:hypothetical protein GY45DRAFT_1341197 [Cubamyces sp. BRFM 1775]
MPARAWATDEQWDWLMAKVQDWRTAQKASDTKAFLLQAHNAWSEKWSDRTRLFGDKDPLTTEELTLLGAAVAERQKKLRVWFQNHGLRGSDSQKSKPDTPTEKPKTMRSLQEVEIYTRKYYKERVKPLVHQKIQRVQRETGRKLTNRARLEIIRRFMRTVYGQESEEVKTAIAAEVAVEKARMHELLKQSRSDTTSNGTMKRTLEQYQHTINNAPALLERAIGPIQTMTSGVYTVLWLGPIPEEGGVIGSFAVHYGQDAPGRDFGKSTPNFVENFVRPHVEFARAAFPKEAQQKMALRPRATDASSSTQSAASGAQASLPTTAITTSEGPTSGIQEGLLLVSAEQPSSPISISATEPPSSSPVSSSSSLPPSSLESLSVTLPTAAPSGLLAPAPAAVGTGALGIITTSSGATSSLTSLMNTPSVTDANQLGINACAAEGNAPTAPTLLPSLHPLQASGHYGFPRPSAHMQTTSDSTFDPSMHPYDNSSIAPAFNLSQSHGQTFGGTHMMYDTGTAYEPVQTQAPTWDPSTSAYHALLSTFEFNFNFDLGIDLDLDLGMFLNDLMQSNDPELSTAANLASNGAGTILEPAPPPTQTHDGGSSEVPDTVASERPQRTR